MKSPPRGPINLCAFSLYVILLCLVTQLWAKCPTPYVEIRGKIQCSFKPDDKILATLIFHDHQLEGSGEQAAFDIRGDIFGGRIAFNTYSCSSLERIERIEQMFPESRRPNRRLKSPFQVTGNPTNRHQPCNIADLGVYSPCSFS
jgi:hypothetical protein